MKRNENLINIRLKKGFTQKSLSKKSNISISLIRKLECGDRTIEGMKVENMINLVIALDCKISDLIVDKEDLKKKCIERGI